MLGNRTQYTSKHYIMYKRNEIKYLEHADWVIMYNELWIQIQTISNSWTIHRIELTSRGWGTAIGCLYSTGPLLLRWLWIDGCAGAGVFMIYSVSLTSPTPPFSNGIEFWRKCSRASKIDGNQRCCTQHCFISFSSNRKCCKTLRHNRINSCNGKHNNRFTIWYTEYHRPPTPVLSLGI